MAMKKNYKNATRLILILLSLILVLSGCSGVKKGSEAPNFTLADLEGKKVTLFDLRDKNVYLNFWASWCDPCKDEMPDIEKIHQEYLDKELIVLTINTGEDKETVAKFMEEKGYTFPVLLDLNLDVAREYYTSNIPVSFFINKEGKVIEKKEGLMSGTEMKEAIELLSK
jgi:thiol-disulfide isomerase/thioredoxin